MFKVLRLRSWNLHADDLDEMVKFYRDTLGGDLRATQTIGGVAVARVRVGETGLGLFDASKERASGVPHHTFDIEGPSDPEELVQELRGKGVRVDGLRRHGNGPAYSVYIIDPSGNRLELSKSG